MKTMFYFILLAVVLISCDNSNSSSKELAVCGDNVADEGEICDSTDLNENDCTLIGLGFSGGTLSCDNTCHFNVSGCVANHPDCGNNSIDGSEVCDGTELGGENCETIGLGYIGGTLGCKNCTFDISQCTIGSVCGDGFCDDGETEVSCSVDCVIPEDCGNGLLDNGEECDENHFGNETCSSRGFYSGGTLVCNSICQINDSGCEQCGDGIIQAGEGEECDGFNIDNATCGISNETTGNLGTPVCDSSCQLIFDNCKTDNWSSITAMHQYTCGIKGNDLFCWGKNYDGQIGQNQHIVSHSLIPLRVPVNNPVMVSGLGSHSCAVLSDGTVWCWGYNSEGQLGAGHNNVVYGPVQTIGITNAVSVSIGYYHSCAILENGEIWCWGRNSDGSLGAGYIYDSFVPVQVKNITNAVTMTSGGNNNCAVLSDGTIWFWGENWSGQGGDGTTTHKYVPVQVLNISNAVKVVGGHTMCALLETNNIKCWGLGWTGHLGNGLTDDATTPVDVLNIDDAQNISGGERMCALRSNGETWCWGSNASMVMSGVPANATPLLAGLLPNGFTISGQMGNHSCGITSEGTALCFGTNNYGELGDDTTIDSATPVAVRNIEFARCIDYVDNDGNGRIDCADSACADIEMCGPEDTDETCSDRIDNDADGYTDCEDNSCSGYLVCGPENGTEWCMDWVDNDGDGLIDCNDPDCDGFSICGAEIGSFCNDRIDNDGDGLIDCFDPGCNGSAACGSENTDLFCSDWVDNDGDGLSNCFDPDCFGFGGCGPEDGSTLCSDWIDNDGDGFIDCFDSKCASQPFCGAENTYEFCSDTIDNDTDYLIDDNDPDCEPFKVSIFEIFLTNETFDLDNMAVIFTPDGMGTYTHVVVASTGFPVNPVNTITLSDNSASTHTLPFNFPYFWGKEHSQVFMGSNGFITFDGSSFDGSSFSGNESSLSFHRYEPRIAAFWDDLDPSQGGTTYVDITATYAAFTWDNIPELNIASNKLNAQIVIHDSGIIEIHFGTVSIRDGLVGISPGNNIPEADEINLF
jgi:alpha-tubulin suppressor-like RCC1 family protein